MTALTPQQLSLLALDAYKHVEPGLNLTPPLGAAVIGTYSDLGFSATAYDVDGKVVISYVGTTDLVLDPLTGWSPG